ncbi:MAG: hypothetical protein Q7J78_00290, partial [Clostridiales bacterium]|nr:hypothetical protein [Clostridiales bacterium]
NGVIIRYNVDPSTQIKKEIEITLAPDSSKVTALHRLSNKGPLQVELAAWSLSVMAAGGREVIPQISGGNKLLPNRMLSLWPYTKLNDKRVHWGEKYIMLDQIPGKETDSPYKIGLPVADGWAAYSNHGHLFIKKFPFYEGVEYPDYSASSYETYTNHFMLEMETLSPLVLLDNEESVEHTEEWFLYENVKRPETENDINQTILPLIK